MQLLGFLEAIHDLVSISESYPLLSAELKKRLNLLLLFQLPCQLRLLRVRS